VSIPFSIATRFRIYSWRNIAKDSAALWLALYGASIPLGYILFDFTPISTVPYKFWVFAVLFVAWLALLILVEYKRVPEWLATIASVLLTLLYASEPIRRFFTDREFGLSSLVLWFFGCTVLVILELKVRTRQSLLYDGGWSKPLVTHLLYCWFSQLPFILT